MTPYLVAIVVLGVAPGLSALFGLVLAWARYRREDARAEEALQDIQKALGPAPPQE